MISIVIPAYNEEKNVIKAYEEISEILRENEISAEYIFVDDGSKDKTWYEISLLGKKHPEVKGISFSRNFGKEAAILAGLKNALGECCVVMDADLQHPPEKIVDMYKEWEKGYEVIEGIKISRGRQSTAHNLFAKLFYVFISNAVGMDMRQTSDFKLLDRKVVDILLDMPERQPFFRALSSWVGFKSTTVDYDVNERKSGDSKWSCKMLVKYAINNITSFTSAPMQIVSIMGIVFAFFALIMSVQTLVRYFGGASVDGFTTVILLQLITGSVIMISIGIIGLYISKIYVELKSRPRYIVSSTVNKNISNNDK